MNQARQIESLQICAIISDKFIEPGLEYWFSDHEHVRSPFPHEILGEVKERTSEILFEWIEGLSEKELDEMGEDEFVEMFETILFNEAIKLVDDEDQRFTISYPFMPRLADIVKHNENGMGKVIGRKEIMTKEQKKMLELTVQSETSAMVWTTEFELTA
ncbi:MAG: hypothetical protein WCL21_09790 [Mariniphaga sp.]